MTLPYNNMTFPHVTTQHTINIILSKNDLTECDKSVSSK